AKSFPSMFKVDSVNITKGSKEVIFESKEKILGGIFIVLFNNRSQMFDIILDNGSNFTIITDTSALKTNMQCIGSIDNEINIKTARITEKYIKQLSDTKLKETEKEKIKKAMNEETNTFRASVIKEHPNLLVSKIYAAIQPPMPPEGKHYLSDGK